MKKKTVNALTTILGVLCIAMAVLAITIEVSFLKELTWKFFVSLFLGGAVLIWIKNEKMSSLLLGILEWMKIKKPPTA